MTVTQCLADHDLLPLVEGESAPPEAAEHLEHCSSCRRRVERLRSEFDTVRSALRGLRNGDDQSASRNSQPAIPEHPVMIGRYAVVGVLDEGGQAVVYRAVHPALNRDLVIKLGRKRMPNPATGEHLLVEEGRLLAELDHPNLARVFDLDFHEGCPFLAMEYIRGRTLEQEAKENPPTPCRAAAIVAKVARALAVAHRQGIIHQDIKPRNILIDDKGEPRLIDFGMARLRQAWAEEDHQPTSTGGTIAYMPPEQARGEAARIGPRSDIFALGAVLYFLLTGKPPYVGSDLLKLLEQASRCDFDCQSLQNCHAPRRLNRICLRAMAPRPEDRFASAEEMASALERYAHRPVLWRRTAAAAAVLGLSIGGGAWAWHHLHWTDGHTTQSVVGELQNQDMVRILRADRPLPLKSAMPLRAGDQVQVVCEIPKGWNYVMLALDTSGRVNQLKPDTAPGSRADTIWLQYPPGGQAAPIDEQGGTEMILVCASPNGLSIEAVKQLLQPVKPLPRLPANVLVRLDRGQVRPVTGGRDAETLGQPIASPVPQVQQVLDALRTKLLAQKVEFLAGVAFSH